jgi:hypothetical protein
MRKTFGVFYHKGRSPLPHMSVVLTPSSTAVAITATGSKIYCPYLVMVVIGKSVAEGWIEPSCLVSGHFLPNMLSQEFFKTAKCSEKQQ